MKSNLKQILEVIKDEGLSEKDLKTISRRVNDIRRYAYKNNATEYRGVDRTFKDDEVEQLINVVENIKYRTFFLILAYLGLRTGEAQNIRLEDVNLEERSIKIRTFKQRKIIIDIHPIPEVLVPYLKLYVKRYKVRIEHRNGWFFPSDKHNDKPICMLTLRKKFAEYRSICKCDMTYGTARDENNPVQKRIGSRKLHNRTLYSFRHWYKVRLEKVEIPYGIVRALMRHGRRTSTDYYGQYSLEEKKEAVERVFY